MTNQRKLIEAVVNPYFKDGTLQGNRAALVSDINDLLNDPALRTSNASGPLLTSLDMALRQALVRDYQPKVRQMINDLLAVERQEARAAAFRDAIQIVDTAPLCYCAGKQYVDPVALVQRLNAAPGVPKDSEGEGEGVEVDGPQH